MLHLTFAPDANGLLTPFFSTLRNSWTDPFMPPVLVAPNHAAGTWLKLRIARALGCSINLKVETIESVLWNALQPDNSIHLLDKKTLQQIIAALLDEKMVSIECNAPVRSYLAGEGIIDSVKRVQLASEIARLFLEYEYNRPSVWDGGNGELSAAWRVQGVERSWLGGNSRYFTSYAATDKKPLVARHEAWQHHLYNKLFGAGGLLNAHAPSAGEESSPRYYTLPQLYRLSKEQSQCGSTGLVDNRPLLLFLISKISHFHRNALLEMSLSREIHLFLVNPCSEFWEDVDTTRNRRGIKGWSSSAAVAALPIPKMKSEAYQAEKLDLGIAPSENRLLELWGAGGKENIALWCQAAQYNFSYLDSGLSESSDATALSRIQTAILTRDVYRPGPDVASDSSVRFFAAPDKGREMETIRENILDLLYRNPQYRVDDMVVYIPDIGRYLPYIHKVFGGYVPADAGYIPYTVAEGVAQQNSYARGVKEFLALCDKGFTRAGVFGFLRNKCVLSAIGGSRDELAIWERWAAATGSCRGYDAGHRLAMGDSQDVASDEHTFVFGEARLLLGPLAVSAVPLGLSMQSAPQAGVAPYDDFDTSDRLCVERYCEIIERCAKTCISLRRLCQEEKISALVEMFLEMVDGWIKADDADDVYCRQIIHDAVTVIGLQEKIAGRTGISFDEFKTAVLALLPDELPGSTNAFAGNLTFSSLRPGYVLPHKVIMAAGMDAESFPGMNAETPFNLMSARRIIGDADVVKDNRYLFLELVCSAGDGLVISYQGADIRNDRLMQPSSVVQELADFAGMPLPDPAGTLRKGVVPIAAYDAANPAMDIPCWDSTHARSALIVEAAKQRFKYRFPAYYGDTVTGSDTSGMLNNMVNLTVADVAMFLKNPLEYRLMRSLHLRNEKPDMTLATEDEPIESGGAGMHKLKRELLCAIVKDVFENRLHYGAYENGNAASVDEKVEAAYSQLVNAGMAPEAGFALFESSVIKRWARSAGAAISALADTAGECAIADPAACSAEETGVCAETRIELADNIQVRLTADHPLLLVPLKKDRPAMLLKTGYLHDKLSRMQQTDLWLTALLLAVNGNAGCCIVNVHSVTGIAEMNQWIIPQPWSPAAAAGWLREVLTDMVSRKACEHAPAIWFEKVDSQCNGFGTEFIRQLRAVEEAENLDDAGNVSLYRPFSDIMRLAEARLPGDDEIIGKVYRRLYPVLRGRFSVND